MKSVIFLLAKLMSIAVVTVLLLSVGVEPASAAGFPKPPLSTRLRYSSECTTAVH
jgi:hypothetical protein